METLVLGELLLSISHQVLVQEHMKHRLQVQEFTVKLAHQWILVPLPMMPMTPGTPGGRPMTPGGGGLDLMSPAVGGDNDGPWFLPDILVNVGRSAVIGVIREVLLDGVCRVALGSTGNGDVITANPNEIEVVVPRTSDKVKVLNGAHCGATGKLIGVDGTDGIVKVDDTLDVKILDMVALAKLARLS